MHNAITENQRPQGAALYIHWPFCKKKCPYCDFNSHVRDTVDQEAWRAALLSELRYWRERSTATMITSIFFGGGTPSLMPVSTVEALLREVQQLWQVSDDLEVTLEANPTSVEAEKFAVLASVGVNRVSLGVQSLRADALTFLGRELPDQTVGAWTTELQQALKLARGHLSLYQLTIEPNTAFHHLYHVQKHFDLPDEVRASELYHATQEIMKAAGLPAYEISNHAAAGQESRHNLAYWRGDHYIGIGPGAHGRVADSAGIWATKNLPSPERWLEAASGRLDEMMMLSETERMEEKILMGLRLTQEGFDLNRLAVSERMAFEDRIADGR
ncbi:MAG: hypothetical protein B7X02_00630, partial [Rhodospirillales bacterium 12-54-5]